MSSTYLKLPVSSSGGGGAVSSFNGRTGAVVPVSGDYSGSLITNTPAGNISATTTQAAINELDTEKQATITGAATSITSANLTASRALASDGSGKVAVSSVTSTELGYVSGVTSSIQTQLNAKEPSITTLPVSKGGTNSGTALNNNRVMQSSGGAIIEAAAITASRALASNANGIPVAATTTAAELDFVSGVTSAIQTQLNNKQPLDSDLTAVAGLATTGLIARTGSGTASTRTITGTASNITVTNGDGVSGNPTIDLPNTAVTPGTYSLATVTVDAKGRLTAVTNGSPAAFDVDSEYDIYDDFDGPTTALLNSPLQMITSGTGAAIATGMTLGVNSTQHAIGVFQFQSGTINNSRSGFSNDPNSYANDAGWTYYSKMRMCVDSYGTLTDPYVVFFGFSDTQVGTAQTPTDGAVFRQVFNGTSTVWTCVTSAAGVQTTTTTATTVTLNNFQTFEITLTDTSCVFSINGAVVATHTTNLPTAGQLFGHEAKIIKTAAGTAVETNMYFDYTSVTATRGSAR